MGSTSLYERNLFGEKLEPPVINVYHDESGVFGCSRWCLTGLIWCRYEDESFLVGQMLEVRGKHEYWNKIHYSELPGRFDGEYNADARVARDWLNLYIGKLSNYTWLNVLAVDTHHEAYNAKRFKHSFHAYNRFTSIALYSGLKWHFPSHCELRLSLSSDNKIRRPFRSLGDGIETDNFEEYIIERLLTDANNDTSCPQISFELPIKMVDIPKNRTKKDIKNEEELTQLCDLLLGAIYSATAASSQTEVKTWLGKTITPLILDTRQKPWKQSLGLHKRFSVSYFPTRMGDMYSCGEVALMDKYNQPKLPL